MLVNAKEYEFFKNLKALLHCHPANAIVVRSRKWFWFLILCTWTIFFFPEAYRIFSLSSVFWNFTTIYMCWALNDFFQFGNSFLQSWEIFHLSSLILELQLFGCWTPRLFLWFLYLLYSVFHLFKFRKLTFIGRLGYNIESIFFLTSSDNISIKKRNLC